MDKPTLQKLEYYDYRACSKYIAKKLGMRELPHTFWMFLCDTLFIHNGMYSEMPYDDQYDEEDEGFDPVFKTILATFEEEFGANAEYLFSW